MSILSELNTLISVVIPIETGIFSEKAPDEYVVITPLIDTFAIHADNRPQIDIQEVRLSLFSNKNYNKTKNQLVKLLLQADFTITERKYVGFETDTSYHHFAIDVAKDYFLKEVE